MLDRAALASLTMTEILRLQHELQQELARRFERPLLLMFSDIVGSTPYFARHGDSLGRQLHLLHLDLVQAGITPHGGRVVDAIGDGAFCVFDEVEAGVAGVVAFEQALARANAGRTREHQISVRIGLHWGPVLTDGRAVSGDAVHVAARVARAAAPGAVALTRAVLQRLPPARRLQCRSLGVQPLKGLGEPITLHELDWRDPVAFPRRVRIEPGGKVFELPAQDIVSFGRLAEHDGERANDIVLAHPDPERTRRISRWHFELRRVADGLTMRTLSDGLTTLDGRPLARGAECPVRSGSCIGVGGSLLLHLEGGEHASAGDDDDHTTMVRTETRPAAGSADETELGLPSADTPAPGPATGVPRA